MRRLAFPCVLTLMFAGIAHAEPVPSAALIEEGRYLARAADCSACHSVEGKAAYTGGVPFDLPIGRLYSPNITPDPQHGIGRYTEQQFARAVREGVRADGASLYPAMPYPSYARMSDHEMQALYAWFHYSVTPSSEVPPASTMRWPLSMRWPMTVWRWMFAPKPMQARQMSERSFDDPDVARGAYLVEGPGHCGACHTPRAITLQEKALTARDGPAYLAGGDAVDGWIPPSLRQENRTGLGRWGEDDIVSFLRSGRAQTGSAFGGMTNAILHGTQYLTDHDLHAIARYLRTLPPARQPDLKWIYDARTAVALRKGDVSARGARLYVDNCAACHRTDGRGYPPVFPPLAGNPVVMSEKPDSLIKLLHTGATLPAMQTAPSAFTMPSFAKRLSEREIADVVSFVRDVWGNGAVDAGKMVPKE
ncbi:c-type cytochrome [Acetobacter estunensis]|uniref:C-type cytochrome n=1 Tax=Acetobacter estunensis TaxID=104097 RepID=A0A967B2X4_9PROT|nr:c-type cytochrome [Acetobacter estunensis]